MCYSPPKNTIGSEFINIEIDDQGHTGEGGAKSDAAKITLEITGCNEPVITFSNNDPLTFTETNKWNDYTPIFIDKNITLTDLDENNNTTENFQEGFLTITLQSATINDNLQISEDSPFVKEYQQNKLKLKYKNDTNELIPIGTISDSSSYSMIYIIFDEPYSTILKVQELLRNITYVNKSDNPEQHERIIHFELTDFDDPDQCTGFAEKTITVIPTNDPPKAYPMNIKVDEGGLK